MTPYLLLPLLLLFGYLAGSLTPSIWITRKLKGVDVRDGGSGHATTTNTIRQVGFGAGALVLAIDLIKGFLPMYLAIYYLPNLYWAIPVAIVTVVGHCWPIFAGFRGGMGLATAGGVLLAAFPLGLLVALGVLVALLLIVRHAARATIFTAVLLPPAFWLAGFENEIVLLGLGLAIVIAARFFTNWNRQYRELWLDRDKSGG